MMRITIMTIMTMSLMMPLMMVATMIENRFGIDSFLSHGKDKL